MSENKEREKPAVVPKTKDGAKPVQSSGWRKYFSRKWVFPATYVTAAAIILALMWVIQNSGTTDLKSEGLDFDPAQLEEAAAGEAAENAVPVNAVVETMIWPVENRDEVEVIMPFFEPGASDEEKQAAILQQDDMYMPNTGIALARADNASFNVTAALSGTVTRAESVPSVGNLVEITHDNGLVTIYYSLDEVAVSKGDKVKQGETIAKAGRNELEKNLGVHLHFEVHRDGEPVNPETLLAKTTE